MGDIKHRFQGGVRYYHRHAVTGEAEGKAGSLDWEARKKIAERRQRWKIIAKLGSVALVIGLVVMTFLLLKY